jgi:SAM-dependent methyltransferase
MTPRAPDRIPRSEGASVFGHRADAYHDARPDYPDRVFELLVEPCGLADGCRTLEVGAGSGQATRRALDLGARPLVAVEPDPGFAGLLESLARSSSGALVPVLEAFESADLDAGSFDLAMSATAFHWLDRDLGPRKLGACLRFVGPPAGRARRHHSYARLRLAARAFGACRPLMRISARPARRQGSSTTLAKWIRFPSGSATMKSCAPQGCSRYD